MHSWPDERLERSIADAIAMGAGLREITTAATAAAIRIAIQSEHGNLQRAAKRLGVTDRALQMRRAGPRSRSTIEAHLSPGAALDGRPLRLRLELDLHSGDSISGRANRCSVRD